ncbi:MAG: hypothetical protein RLP15_07220 [Cryomorphaceae bacterium]
MKSIQLTILGLVLTLSGYTQVEVLKAIDQKYALLKEVSIQQTVLEYIDASDKQPTRVNNALINMRGEYLISEGPSSLIMVSPDYFLKMDRGNHTVYLGRADEGIKGNLLSPNLQKQLGAADTFALESREDGMIVLKLLFVTDLRSIVEYLLDPEQLQILSMTEYSLLPRPYGDREKVYPKRVITATSFSPNTDLDISRFKLNEFFEYDANGELVTTSKYDGYVIVNPQNVKPQI